MEKILLSDPNAREQRAVAALLREHGYQLLVATGSECACRLLAQVPDIIVTDLKLIGSDGLGLLGAARRVVPETPVIILTGHGSIASAVEAMKRGTFDYLTKPINPEKLLLVIQRAAEHSLLQRESRRLRQQADEHGVLEGMVGASPRMQRVFEQVQLVAPARSTALLTGESGTGKELVARALHQLSPRKNGPFVALNCAAIPRDLAESELFGHVVGAFTGATHQRVGKFLAADHGTLLIDEIGEMELLVQAKFVRTLETRTISPVGSNQEQSVDVRVVAATHRNLRSLVDTGQFREDLYYRLNVVSIDLPPLRQRQEDIPLLVAAFLHQLNQEHDRNVQGVAPEAMAVLQSHPWPGNIRELHNLLEALLVLSRKEVIEVADLPREIQEGNDQAAAPHPGPRTTLADLERDAIQQCLLYTAGNRQRTAELLGISTRTLLRKIHKYGLAGPLRQTDKESGVRGQESGKAHFLTPDP